MRRVSLIVLAGLLVTGTAYAQSQPGTQAGASAASSTSVEASRSNGVQAGNSSSAGASAQHNTSQAGASGVGNTSAGVNKSGAQANNNAAHSSSAKNPHAAANSGAQSMTSATLVHPIDAKKNKPGDPVVAKTTGRSKGSDGTMLPKGTELEGHVTKAQRRSKGESESELGIVFDKARLKDGREVPMNATIQAMAAAQSAASAAANADDAGISGGSMAGGGAHGGLVGGGGALGAVGGATSSVGAATAPVSNVGTTAGGALGSTAGVAGGASRGAVGGLNATGQLMSNSQGVFNMDGLNLTSSASSATDGSLITSTSRDVHLDSGTQLLLSVAGSASAGAAH